MIRNKEKDFAECFPGILGQKVLQNPFYFNLRQL
jgi:hypothetical protein